MPFEEIIPRKFTSGAIQFYAPARAGIFGISNAQEWILIESADNIRAALLTHLVDWSSALLKRAPTGFVFECCEEPSRTNRQKRLVAEYSPVCNATFSAGQQT